MSRSKPKPSPDPTPSTTSAPPLDDPSLDVHPPEWLPPFVHPPAPRDLPPRPWSPPADPKDDAATRLIKETVASLPKDALHLLLVFAVERLKKCPGGLKWHRQFAQNYAAVACTAKLGMANEEWKRWLTAAYQELRTQKAPMVSRGKKKIRLPGRLVLYNYEFGRRAIEAAKAERARQKSEGGLSQRAVATKWRTALQTVLNDMAKFPMHNEMWVHLVRENELPRELLGAAENSSASEASLAFLCYLYDVSPGYLKKKLFPPLRKSPSVLFCHYLSDPH